MGVRSRIRDSFPAETPPFGDRSIILNGKGVARVNIDGDLFDRVNYELYHEQNIIAGQVDVFAGTPDAPAPELDLSGVWQAVPSSDETTANGNDLISIEKVETLRNRYT